MNLKDVSELANVLGMAFASYANMVQRGFVEPYLPFLEGADTVTVNVTLNGDGSISVVNPVMEAEKQAKAEAQAESTPETLEFAATDYDVQPVEEPAPKKRRKRT